MFDYFLSKFFIVFRVTVYFVRLLFLSRCLSLSYFCLSLSLSHSLSSPNTPTPRSHIRIQQRKGTQYIIKSQPSGENADDTNTKENAKEKTSHSREDWKIKNQHCLQWHDPPYYTSLVRFSYFPCRQKKTNITIKHSLHANLILRFFPNTHIYKQKEKRLLKFIFGAYKGSRAEQFRKQTNKIYGKKIAAAILKQKVQHQIESST